MSSSCTRLTADRSLLVTRAVAAVLAMAAAAPAFAVETGLEEIVVTAQRRETSLQETPVAISAFTGENLADEKVFTAADLAAAVPAFSLTALSPLDQELNMRGITNTRLDSPTSDPSVGTFVDGIYIGRTGDYNFDFYDLERVEVIRGPQGVLLGKNVVGGALSIITARPSQQYSSEITLGLGNYSSKFMSGHVNGGITDSLSGRFSFQYRSHDGYARDILHDRDVEDLDSTQMRAQLLWEPGDSGWSVRGIFDYTRDSNNGINLGHREHLVHHLAHRLRGEFLPVVRAARHAGARVQHAQVVVDLGDRADRRARIVRRRLLLDRDGGGEALDVVDVRLLHDRQELPRVGRQRFDVAPLALGVDGVEGERGLARAGQSGDHDQPVARQVQVDALEVVGAGAADAYEIHLFRRTKSAGWAAC